ncbi:MAG: amidase [Solirubrobacteraceae bacterium]
MPAPRVDAIDAGLLGMAGLLRSGSVSAVELNDAVWRRIEERNGGAPTFDGGPAAINAWVRLYPELAAAAARAADARIAAEGADAPILCGVPLGLKDLIAVAGLPVTASSRVLDGNVAREDSVVWSRLRARNAVLIGHTHTHEFAMGGTCDQVGNPWSLDRSPGGSSGGSAAAVAAGMVPAALGTDTCGSLRIPAAACGVSTIKATHGRIPIVGLIPAAPSLDHVGPIARTVADCAAVMNAIAADGAELMPLMPPPADLGPLPTMPRPGARPLAGVRIAVTDRPSRVALHGDVADGVDEAVGGCHALGATVIEHEAPADFTIDDLNAIEMSEALAYHAQYAGVRDRYRASTRGYLDDSAGFTDVGSYLAAQERRAQLTAQWTAWFAQHRVDAVLEPTIPTVAPTRGAGYDSGRLSDPDPLISLTYTWTITGCPAVALPAGLGGRTGLPVGVSLIAPRGAEQALVQVAIDLQAHVLAPPQLPSGAPV